MMAFDDDELDPASSLPPNLNPVGIGAPFIGPLMDGRIWPPVVWVLPLFPLLVPLDALPPGGKPPTSVAVLLFSGVLGRCISFEVLCCCVPRG